MPLTTNKLTTLHDTKDQFCSAIVTNIPTEISESCACEVDLTGLFDFSLSSSCEAIGGTRCNIAFGGQGNIIGTLFGRAVNLEYDTSCDFGILGGIEMAGSVALSLEQSDVASCSANYDLPLIDTYLQCNCTPGCSMDDPFAVDLMCVNVIDLGCVNVVDAVSEIRSALNLRNDV